MNDGNEPSDELDIRFSHVHLYVDRVCDLSAYKEFEDSLNLFQENYDEMTAGERIDEDEQRGIFLDVDVGRQIWQSITEHNMDDNKSVAEEFASHGRDIVKQLIAGFGFRVTGCHVTSHTSTVVVTSKDANGIQIVASAMKSDDENSDVEEANAAVEDNDYHHFAPSNITRFYHAHSNRQGIAVLAFEVGHQCLEGIFLRYSEHHPELVPKEFKNGPVEYGDEARVFEVFAYYSGERGTSLADEGTMLRFIEPITGAANTCKLPGIAPVDASFSRCHPAFFDHWVSNVISRTGFLDTLKDTLYFTPKVDFNAGVVAAGEAQIESTVTGNTASLNAEDGSSALSDQSQIYLPINNALTEVGHVHGFLEEIGQGVQHIASRVDNIISFVQEANDRRKIFGEGFTFLNIPRSYYGVLTKEMLRKGIDNIKDPSGNKSDDVLSLECAHAILNICTAEGVLLDDSSVDLDISGSTIQTILDSKISLEHKEEYLQNQEEIVVIILHSRYVNMYNLLKNHLSEQSYVAIVRNQILVDVQTDDLLFQIFTSNILQRKPQDESPFFEFIQRVCSQCVGPDGCPKKVKPGCGGFGIRNFLTLFLSIEVTKAMLAASNAKRDGKMKEYEFAKRKVQLFIDQLNESNPLLTEISEAMTKEGAARDNITLSYKEGRIEDAKVWEEVTEKEASAKSLANDLLMECNMKYQRLMRELRESQEDIQ
ncbi:4-hydroxyphenylpyruvate dioxygenase [Skeletonema marinoi]|uniref:4-hydroxyphenylpyruvate dioxygenase n=1 Tax=Skeletonema marinoi TaxID=267567 RepID=A0AAD8XW33_9STRA|nr:4-hydroxyphenylpyruvate dioxygenase [Skeletonema marinoi]